jgi:prolyl-tRNA editing enzyme YbaK/EbsC (Cys-tRNA(Pro) deacylase)
MGDAEELQPGATRVADVLRSRGVKGPFREFGVTTKTAADAAAALGCDVGAIASTLVFIVDEEPTVVLKSGAFRVDLERFRQFSGASSVRQASRDEVRAATGQAVGGVSPVGWPRPLTTYIDESLREHDCIWAACGSPYAVFCTTFDELSSLTGAVTATFR